MVPFGPFVQLAAHSLLFVVHPLEVMIVLVLIILSIHHKDMDPFLLLRMTTLPVRITPPVRMAQSVQIAPSVRIDPFFYSPATFCSSARLSLFVPGFAAGNKRGSAARIPHRSSPWQL